MISEDQDRAQLLYVGKYHAIDRTLSIQRRGEDVVLAEFFIKSIDELDYRVLEFFFVRVSEWQETACGAEAVFSSVMYCKGYEDLIQREGFCLVRPPKAVVGILQKVVEELPDGFPRKALAIWLQIELESRRVFSKKPDGSVKGFSPE